MEDYIQQCKLLKDTHKILKEIRSNIIKVLYG